MSDIFNFSEGSAPLLISIPHLGSLIPSEIEPQLTPEARDSRDTDWHLDTLYEFAKSSGASVLSARYSRYVVDLNRSPKDENLYPGQTKTGLCPTHTFRGDALYLDENILDDTERARRVQKYWKPYHDKLSQEIERLKAKHGAVLLWEAHSIASELPRLFEGKLPDLNIGTADGKACAPSILEPVEEALKGTTAFTSAINGRFKGGYITRQYGAPEANVHAIQLEMCQSTYMNESHPFDYKPEVAARVIPVVEQLVTGALGRLRLLTR